MEKKNRIEEEINFLLRAGRLRSIIRAGQEIVPVENPESITGHSYRLALLSMVYARKLGLDVCKCMEMALIHEIPEAAAKHFAYTDTNINSKEKNRTALNNFLNGLPEKRIILNIWEEYSRGISNEAKLIRDLDKAEMILEILESLKDKRSSLGSKDLEVFIRSTNLKTEAGRKLCNKILDKYLKKLFG